MGFEENVRANVQNCTNIVRVEGSEEQAAVQLIENFMLLIKPNLFVLVVGEQVGAFLVSVVPSAPMHRIVCDTGGQ
jgi:RNA processing factor Prp31